MNIALYHFRWFFGGVVFLEGLDVWMSFSFLPFVFFSLFLGSSLIFFIGHEH